MNVFRPYINNINGISTEIFVLCLIVISKIRQQKLHVIFKGGMILSSYVNIIYMGEAYIELE